MARRSKRVGIRPEGRAPAREGTEIADKTGRVIGKVTSGGFGPSLNAPVAMGYVESAFAANGTKLDLLVRGKALAAGSRGDAVRAAPLQARKEIRRSWIMSEVRFTDQHEWVRLDGDEATVGITNMPPNSWAMSCSWNCPPGGKVGAPAPKPRWWKASRRPAKSMPRSAAKSPPPTARWKPSPPRSTRIRKARAGSSS